MAKERPSNWASDTRPSMPTASSNERLVKMGGFAFTAWGLVHDVDESVIEEMSHPPFGPVGMNDA